MPESLPSELLILVIEHAVDLFLVDDRETLVHLAQTSKTVYAVIAPLIYHSICLSEYGDGFKGFMEWSSSGAPPLAERVFQHARELHTNIIDSNTIPCDLLKNIQAMHVSFNVARAITLMDDITAKELATQSPHLVIPPPPLRRLSVWNCTHTWVPELSARARSGLTHFLACVPGEEKSFETRFNTAPRQWILDSLKLLPNLTHLGFELYATDYGSELRMVAAYDTKLLKDVLLAALEYRRADGSQLQAIAVRVTGEFDRIWPNLLEMMQQVEDEDRTGRLRAWRDVRLVNGENWRGLLLKDGHAKRSVWTEARAVGSFLVPSLSINGDEGDTSNQNSGSTYDSDA